jgi:hypothetical protein
LVRLAIRSKVFLNYRAPAREQEPGRHYRKDLQEINSDFTLGRAPGPIIRSAAHIESAEKKSARSAAIQKELAEIVTKSRDLGYMGIELDARLALAEIEKKTGQSITARAQMTAIGTDATAKGYNRITREATADGQ